MKPSPPNLSNLSELSPAEKRRANDRAAWLELKAYKSSRKLSAAKLAAELGYSPDAAEDWLKPGGRVPGGVIIAIRGGKAAA